MNKIYLSANYIIVERQEGDDPAILTEFAIAHTVYTRRFNGQFPAPIDQFQIVEGGISPKANGRVVIPVSELDPDTGVWFDETGLIRFTDATLTTFLRENTGFNPASGSSGAELQFIEVPITAAEMVKFYDGTGIDILPPCGVGNYYDAEKIIFEYKFNSIAYNPSGVAFFVTSCGINLDFQSNIWTNASRSTFTRAIGGESSSGSTFPTVQVSIENKPIRLAPEEPGNTMNDGNGSLVVKLWYRIIPIS
jgi:hypothetical protein